MKLNHCDDTQVLQSANALDPERHSSNTCKLGKETVQTNTPTKKKKNMNQNANTIHPFL